jgi:hypothetical protein
MTKSKGIGRGGKRPGAGKKKKPRAPPIAAECAPTGLSAEDIAKGYIDLALETLAHIARNGTSEPARVAAADKLLDRAIGKPKPGSAKTGDADDRKSPAPDSWGALLGGDGPRPN